MNKSLVFAAIFMAVLCMHSVWAADRVLSNSEDWRDVYSVVQYANLLGTSSSFLVSQQHATIITYGFPAGSSIQVISSSKYPFVTGYYNILAGAGFAAEELVFDNVNLELARRLTSIRKFVVIDDAYGYNAVAVAPYAEVSGSYVLFADRNNIGDIASFLSARNPEKVIIFGPVNREVRTALAQFNPEIINKDGDRFDNNIEIVKRYMEIKPSKQVILTNGEFIEQEIMSGTEPVLFIGANNVPEQIKAYIKSAGIDVGVLIGNQYVGSATTIKRQAGISVFVKFARSARIPSSPIQPVEGLDLFYVPAYRPNLDVVSAVYNQITQQLEITLKNNADLQTYFLGTYRLSWGSNQRQTVGDTTPLFIDAQEYRTIVYDVGPMTGAISGDIYVIYGESVHALEYVIQKTMTINASTVTDNAQIRIVSVVYDSVRKEFQIEVENIGEVDAYVDLQLDNIMIAGAKNNYGADKVTLLKPGERRTIRIKVDMLEDDYPDNEKIHITAYYGERPQNLVKVLQGDYAVSYRGIGYLVYTLAPIAIGVIALILLILFLLRRRGKKTCPSCGEKNGAGRKYCQKCGAELKQ